MVVVSIYKPVGSRVGDVDELAVVCCGGEVLKPLLTVVISRGEGEGEVFTSSFTIPPKIHSSLKTELKCNILVSRVPQKN